MIIQKNILVVNEVISAPKNLKIRYNVEEDGFYRLVAIYEHIDSAKISLRKNNRLEGVFSLNMYFDSGTLHNRGNFSIHQTSVFMNQVFVNRERRQELGVIQLKKGLLTGVLLLYFTTGAPDGRFQLILQKVRFEEEDAQ